jgi:uncharacterized C2H2 Zn-finger protein
MKCPDCDWDLIVENDKGFEYYRCTICGKLFWKWSDGIKEMNLRGGKYLSRGWNNSIKKQRRRIERKVKEKTGAPRIKE